ncbi:unknown [Firmicutes bacterium CAG:65]|jgi:hypothetical protein|nr:unknown [Firmicutes bacterium CAG:65]
MLNCISKENLLYVKASNIFVVLNLEVTQVQPHMQLFLTMEDKL